MVYFEYEILTKSVKIKYRCPICNSEVESQWMAVPKPNYETENQGDSEVEIDYDCACPKCGHSIGIELVNGLYYGRVVIPELEEGQIIDTNILEEDDDYNDPNYGYYNEAYQILREIDPLPDDTKIKLYRLLYANAISYMEAYLSNTLKSMALHNEESLRFFVEHCTDLGKRTVKLKDIFLQVEHLKDDVKLYLNDLIYHNLPKIKQLYYDCVGIDIGDISNLMIAVTTRHDIVHRNGASKEGQVCNISKVDVEQVWTEVQNMKDYIEQQRSKKDLEKMFAEKGLDVGF